MLKLYEYGMIVIALDKDSESGAICERTFEKVFEQIAKVELRLDDNELNYAIELVGPEPFATSDVLCTCGGITEEQIAGLIFKSYKDFEARRHFRLAEPELPI